MAQPIPPISPALRFDAQWRVLPGASHGLGQPTMLGQAHARSVVPARLAELDVHMAQFIPEAPPPLSSPDDNAAVLVERALFWAAAVQRQCKVPVFHAGCCWPAGDVADGDMQFEVAVSHVAPAATQAALDWVVLAMCSHLGHGEPASDALPGIRSAWEQLTTALKRHAVPGVNMFRFLAAAHALDIPARRLVGDVYCFGTGRASRWLESSYTDRTSVIGTRIARDKARTAMVLRQAGLPVADHARVGSPAQAVDVARQLGYPVVVKPADLDQGLGVAADLGDDAAVEAAFIAAAGHSRHILVEKHFSGRDYRLTVLHGRVIKTIERQAGGVTGDGLRSVSELVQLAGETGPMVRRTLDRGHAPLCLDQEALDVLSEQGLAPDSVPSAQHRVRLRRRANVSAGGTPTLVVGPIHPDNLRLAERAAAALQLDLAGIDLIAPDIARSWLDTGAIVCEVNGQPQIGSSTSPGIYQEILRELLPGARRMRLALVVGNIGSASDEMVQMAHARGCVLGRSSVDGVWQGSERLTPRPSHSFASAQILLASREVDAAVVIMPLAQILMFGLPFDRCDLVVLAEPATDSAWREMDPAVLWRSVLPPLAGSILLAAGTGRLQPPVAGGPGNAVGVVDTAEVARAIVDCLMP